MSHSTLRGYKYLQIQKVRQKTIGRFVDFKFALTFLTLKLIVWILEEVWECFTSKSTSCPSQPVDICHRVTNVLTSLAQN